MKNQLIAATAAFALMGSAAMAQPTSTQATDSTTVDMAQPTTSMASDANAAAVTTSTTTTDTTGASVTTSTVTNGPVADTPENRAKYGQPMSNAGKRTAARGN